MSAAARDSAGFEVTEHDGVVETGVRVTSVEELGNPDIVMLDLRMQEGKAIDTAKADLVVLAGFMRVLTADFVDRYHGRLINIHPALLPAFGGKGYYGGKVRTERDLVAVSDMMLCLCMPLHA